MSFMIKLPVKTPHLLKRLYSGYIWDYYPKSSATKKLYLTFDDGPIPEVTPWVLETLNSFDAKATFFCIGENITKHPEVFKQLIESPHALGNHTFNHLKGWKTDTKTYLENALKTEALLEDAGVDPKLFRPPYGKIKRKQARALKNLGHKIIMYDVIAYDWDASISPENCTNKVLKHAVSGSIIVFHDSLKAQRNMKTALPAVLDHFKKLGFEFETL